MRLSKLFWIAVIFFMNHAASAQDILIWDFKVLVRNDPQFSVTCIDSAPLHPANDNRGGSVFSLNNCNGSFNPPGDWQASVKSIPGSGFAQLYVKIPGLTPSSQYCVAEYNASIPLSDDGHAYDTGDISLSPLLPSCTVFEVRMTARGRHWSGCNWQHYQGGDVMIVHRNWYDYGSQRSFASEPGYVISSLDRIEVAAASGLSWRDTGNNLVKKVLGGVASFALTGCGGGLLERLEVWVGSLDFSIFGAGASSVKPAVSSALSVKTPTGQVQVSYGAATEFSVGVLRSGSSVTTTTAVMAGGGVVETGNNGAVTNIGAGGSHSTAALATATRDFDGDSKSDLLWRDSSGVTGIWKINGASVTQTATLGSVPTDWEIVAQRDFTSDGRYDIVWRNLTDGTIGIWQMNGTALAQTMSLGAVSTSWKIAGTADFNADQSNDILWRDDSGAIGIWLMKGTEIVQTAGLGSVPTNWQIVGVADFNGDGKADILWRDNSGGAVGIWFLDGVSIVTTASLGAVPGEWKISSTADVDGDGKADIIWRQDSGTVAIWRMNGSQILEAKVLGSIASSWSIVGTGDFDGNGKSDLLWRDSGGAIGIWFMNSTQVASTAGLGSVATSWVIQATNAN